MVIGASFIVGSSQEYPKLLWMEWISVPATKQTCCKVYTGLCFRIPVLLQHVLDNPECLQNTALLSTRQLPILWAFPEKFQYIWLNESIKKPHIICEAFSGSVIWANNRIILELFFIFVPVSYDTFYCWQNKFPNCFSQW